MPVIVGQPRYLHVEHDAGVATLDAQELGEPIGCFLPVGCAPHQVNHFMPALLGGQRPFPECKLFSCCLSLALSHAAIMIMRTAPGSLGLSTGFGICVKVRPADSR